MKTPLRVIAIILLLGFTVTVLAGAPPQNSEPAKVVPAANRSEAVRLNNLGTAYVNQQVFEKAASYFHQAVQADPNLVFARLNEGIALANSQKIEEAKAAFEEVVKREPENPRGWYNLGLLDKSIRRRASWLRTMPMQRTFWAWQCCRTGRTMPRCLSFSVR
jgi:tetratricopeptide (TPR) repeat protein